MSIRTQSLLIGFVVLAGCSHPDPLPVVASPVTVRAQMFTIHAARLPDEYEATGTVRAELNATLASKVTGRVQSVSVHDGDSVRAGQPLVAIDARELQASASVADAAYRSSLVNVSRARMGAEMEARTNAAQISAAMSQVAQARAALEVARSRRDLAQVGPRPQEVDQSHIAVVTTESGLKLAAKDLQRIQTLVDQGALARRELDLAQNRYDLAKGQRDAAVQGESIAREGSRTQDIQAAKDLVTQAAQALEAAKAGLSQARAASLQVKVRQRDIDVAQAQADQAKAEAASAHVGASYAQVLAPFDGRVVQRMVDPGAMAVTDSPLMRIEGGWFRLEIVVPEKLLPALRVGESIPVRIDSRALKATVAEIQPQGDAQAHNFVVKLVLPSSAGVKSGMFGRASLRLGSSSGFEIPLDAEFERQGLDYVFAIDSEGLARLRLVTLGRRWVDGVEVLSGLSAGDRIVVGHNPDVVDGVKIEAGKP